MRVTAATQMFGGFTLSSEIQIKWFEKYSVHVILQLTQSQLLIRQALLTRYEVVGPLRSG